MVTTLGALAKAEPALQRLAQQPIKSTTAYHLFRLLKLVQAETPIYHKQYRDLVRSHGDERDPTPLEAIQGQRGKVQEIPPGERMDAFLAQLDELSTIAVTLDDKWLLTMALLAELKVSAADLLALGDLVRPD